MDKCAWDFTAQTIKYLEKQLVFHQDATRNQADHKLMAKWDEDEKKDD
jgi:hypothetical protein